MTDDERKFRLWLLFIHPFDELELERLWRFTIK